MYEAQDKVKETPNEELRKEIFKTAIASNSSALDNVLNIIFEKFGYCDEIYEEFKLIEEPSSGLKALWLLLKDGEGKFKMSLQKRILDILQKPKNPNMNQSIVEPATPKPKRNITPIISCDTPFKIKDKPPRNVTTGMHEKLGEEVLKNTSSMDPYTLFQSTKLLPFYEENERKISLVRQAAKKLIIKNLADDLAAANGPPGIHIKPKTKLERRMASIVGHIAESIRKNGGKKLKVTNDFAIGGHKGYIGPDYKIDAGLKKKGSDLNVQTVLAHIEIKTEPLQPTKKNFGQHFKYILWVFQHQVCTYFFGGILRSEKLYVTYYDRSQMRVAIGGTLLPTSDKDIEDMKWSIDYMICLMCLSETDLGLIIPGTDTDSRMLYIHKEMSKARPDNLVPITANGPNIVDKLKYRAMVVDEIVQYPEHTFGRAAWIYKVKPLHQSSKKHKPNSYYLKIVTNRNDRLLEAGMIKDLGRVDVSNIPKILGSYIYPTQSTFRHELLVISDCGKPIDEYLAENITNKDLESILQNIIKQVITTIFEPYTCGYLHRDISSGNIVVDDSGKATLIDWGCARQYNTIEPIESPDYLTGTGIFLSIRMLKRYKNRTFTDDVESAFYVACRSLSRAYLQTFVCTNKATAERGDIFIEDVTKKVSFLGDFDILSDLLFSNKLYPVPGINVLMALYKVLFPPGMPKMLAEAEEHDLRTDNLNSFLGGFVDYFGIDRELIEKVEAAFNKSLEYDKANNEFTKDEMYALGLELASLRVDKDLTSYDSIDDIHGSPFD
ncbi:hypothetical protein H4219_004005 [Mycoemilia scoparia]|uniref:Protein kinase domain-containing protein n=1 Tax=Mycoemilia scoparia TaxID=417184 RepID=A0A9W7ZYU9_9FUNG|nr:hypothetical protein H4219_004005 [Mycoemilia scoparia]